MSGRLFVLRLPSGMYLRKFVRQDKPVMTQVKAEALPMTEKDFDHLIAPAWPEAKNCEKEYL